MSPVEPLSAVAAANVTLSATVSPSLVQTAPSSPNSPSVEELTSRFRTMMESPHAVNAAPPTPQDSALTYMMADGNDPMKHAEQKIVSLREQAPFMTPSELTMATIELSNSVSIDTFRMQAATSIASGANKSLQSLLKNQ
ncbi:hypothetical protein [Variovorax sp. 770b2]|uniref:hypothetical protein n=1 Tax=Variovorax sp. 770b2 TaxID=1566271 RepID=UPI001160989E|nr:hypothetical protein [Variovorax sp. 770b2]